MPVRHRFSVGDLFCLYVKDNTGGGDGRKTFLVFYLTGETQKPRIGKSRTEKIFTFQILTKIDDWPPEALSGRSVTSRWLSALCSEPCRVRGWRQVFCEHVPVAS